MCNLWRLIKSLAALSTSIGSLFPKEEDFPNQEQFLIEARKRRAVILKQPLSEQ